LGPYAEQFDTNHELASIELMQPAWGGDLVIFFSMKSIPHSIVASGTQFEVPNACRSTD